MVSAIEYIRAMELSKVEWIRRIAGPPMRRIMGSLTHVETAEQVAALTFDDGPDAEATPRLLEILDRHGVRGTFFVLGEHAVKQRGLIRRMAEAGHAIGNHSWDHPSFPFITSRERRRQIRACAEAVAPHGQRLFRPPYGEQSVASRLDLLFMGYDVILFNREVSDWCERNTDRLAEGLIRCVRPGDIVCLHDAIRWHRSNSLVPKLTAEPYVDRGAMLSALERFLDHVNSHMRFVTVPELLKLGRMHRANWYRVTPPQA